MIVLRFYSPVNPLGSCREQSVYLTTLLLGRLSLYVVNQYCAHSSARNWQLPFLNQWKGENDFMINLYKRMKWRNILYGSTFRIGHSDLGPVVQSIVSLTSSLRVISLTVLVDSIYNTLIFFAEKMWVAFALQKLLTFFQQKISEYLRITRCKF